MSEPRLPGSHAVGRHRRPPVPDDTFMNRGACRNKPPELWWPADKSNGSEAKAVCRVCPVRGKCLDFAIATGMQHIGGIWGGMGRLELRAEARRRRKLLVC